MSKMLEYHTRAMDFVAQATVGSIVEPVDEARKHELFRQALDWGLKAIEELDKLEYHDLTYSVIHRSIAATALDCGEYQLAEQAGGESPSSAVHTRQSLKNSEMSCTRPTSNGDSKKRD